MSIENSSPISPSQKTGNTGQQTPQETKREISDSFSSWVWSLVPFRAQLSLATNHVVTPGLVNESGSCCFINALRQFFYNTPLNRFIETAAINSDEKAAIRLYQDMEDYILRPNTSPMGGSKSIRKNLIPHMEQGQQDAHEALVQITTKLGLSVEQYPEFFPEVEHLYNGKECPSVPELVSGLAIKDGEDKQANVMGSIQQVWDFFAKPEFPEKQLEEQGHHYRFKKLPSFLFFHFKRYYLDQETVVIKKIDNPIQNSGTFKLDERHVKSGQSGTFSIQAFIAHYGVYGSGHYISYVLKDGKWSRCNDSKVHKISDEEAKDAMSRALIFYAKSSDQQLEEAPSSQQLEEAPSSQQLEEAPSSQQLEEAPSSLSQDLLQQSETPSQAKEIVPSVNTSIAATADSEEKSNWTVITDFVKKIPYNLGYYLVYKPLYYVIYSPIHAVAMGVYIAASSVFNFVFGVSPEEKS